MGIKLNYITSLLAVAAAAVAIAAAPAAVAANQCSSVGPGTECQTPGNVQINDSPPPVQYRPYGDMPYLLGGH